MRYIYILKTITYYYTSWKNLYWQQTKFQHISETSDKIDIQYLLYMGEHKISEKVRI